MSIRSVSKEIRTATADRTITGEEAQKIIDTAKVGPITPGEIKVVEDLYNQSKWTCLPAPAGAMGNCHMGRYQTDAEAGKKLQDFLIEAKSGGVKPPVDNTDQAIPGAVKDDQLSPAKLDSLKAKFAAAKDTLAFADNQSPPVGSRFTRVLLEKEPGFDTYSYYALLPTGAMNPTVPAGDPDDAKIAWIVREGGFAGISALAGPVSLDD